MKTFIVDFANIATQEQIDTFLSEHNLTVVKTFNHFEKLYLVSGEETQTLTAASSQSSIIEHFVNDTDHPIQLLDTYTVPPIQGPEETFQTNTEQDWWKTYSCTTIDVTQETQTIKRLGKNVSVYIMDSGIERTHPEFVDTTIIDLFTFTDNFNDTKGHGTAMASVIAGKTCGLTDATLKIVKIYDKDIPTRQSDFINALDAIASDFAVTPRAAGILNMSWVIPKNSFIESKIQLLIDMGILAVCSAGNNGTPIQDVTPASMASALTIGAYDANFLPCDFSDYTNSNVGTTQNQTNHGALDGWGPGINIWAAYLNNSYMYWAGTSLACAITSGALAYNLSNALDSNNEIYGPVSDYELVEPKTISLYSLSRPLMILEGKYQDSVNKVTTYFVSSRIEAPPFIKTFAQKGKFNTIKIFNPGTIKSVSYTTLPEGMYFEKNWLVGTPTQDLHGNPYAIDEIIFSVVLADDSVDSIMMQIGILSEDFDQSTLSPDDPIIPIILTPGNNCDGSSCNELACGPTGCSNVAAPKGVNCMC